MYFLCVLLMSNMLRMPFAVVYDYAADVFYAVQFYPMPLRIVYHSLGFVGIENAVQRAFAWYRHYRNTPSRLGICLFKCNY